MRVGTMRGGTVAAVLWLGMGLLRAGPASAQQAPIGPCSPYATAEGDIASEMPGCARRARPAQGWLAEELQFRRDRGRGEDVAADPTERDETPAPHRPRRRAGGARAP